MWIMICYYIALWHFVGFVILSLLAVTTSLGNVHGFPCFNPKWLHDKYPLNWFGAVLCAIGLNICCPIISICYWLYKLCTVGRK